MILNQFHKGVNQVVNPIHLAQDAAQELVNVNTAAVALEAARACVGTPEELIGAGRYVYYFRAEQDIVSASEPTWWSEFGNYLVWSSASSQPMYRVAGSSSSFPIEDGDFDGSAITMQVVDVPSHPPSYWGVPGMVEFDDNMPEPPALGDYSGSPDWSISTVETNSYPPATYIDRSKCPSWIETSVYRLTVGARNSTVIPMADKYADQTAIREDVTMRASTNNDWAPYERINRLRSAVAKDAWSCIWRRMGSKWVLVSEYKYDGGSIEPVVWAARDPVRSPQDPEAAGPFAYLPPNESITLPDHVGRVKGHYEYGATKYNKATGAETVMYEFTAESVAVDGYVLFTGFEDLGLTEDEEIRIYRRGGNLALWHLVDSVPHDATFFVDNRWDSYIAGHTIYNPEQTGEIPGDARYFTEYCGMMFAASTNKLIFSRIGAPLVWPTSYNIILPAEITGIGKTALGLLVFTNTETYSITGTTPETFSLNLLDGEYGCVGHSTVASLKGACIWVARQGLCVSRGAVVELVTRELLQPRDWSLCKFGVVRLSEYYFDAARLATPGLVWCFDFDLGVLKSYKFTSEGKAATNTVNLYSYNGKLMNYDDLGEWTECFASTARMPIKYRSPNFTLGSPTTPKIYKYLNLLLDVVSSTTDAPSPTLRVYIDGVDIGKSYPLVSGLNELKIPSDDSRGWSIGFSIEGPVRVYEVDISEEPANV